MSDTPDTGVTLSQIQRMAALLKEAQDAYTAQIDADKQQLIARLEYAAEVKQSARELKERMLGDWARSEHKLRPSAPEVAKALGMSRANMYLVLKRLGIGR